jgi:hypothetical protein
VLLDLFYLGSIDLVFVKLDVAGGLGVHPL